MVVVVHFPFSGCASAHGSFWHRAQYSLHFFREEEVKKKKSREDVM